MSRLSAITREGLNAAQRDVLEAIESGPRGKMGLIGPFGVYVRVPGIGNALQNLGAAVRFGTALPENVKEVAICTVGALFRAKFEFAAHAELARKAGVADAIVEALRTGATPGFADAAEGVACEVTSELVRDHRIAEATYTRAAELLGETQLIELVVTIGYYTTVSMTLNAFEIPLLEGMTDPWPGE